MTHQNKRLVEEQEIESSRASCHSLGLTRAAMQQYGNAIMQRCSDASRSSVEEKDFGTSLQLQGLSHISQKNIISIGQKELEQHMYEDACMHYKI